MTDPQHNLRVIKRIAHQRMPKDTFVHLFVKQVLMESRLVLKRHVNFRKRSNEQAVRAYCEMALPEFEGINARQKWANWRTIPSNILPLLSDEPLNAIDLCCGTGDSTEVLACYLPTGSTLLGLEFNENFVKFARARKYLDRHRNPVNVDFHVQSVLETFRTPTGHQIEDASVDLVNCCGAVGSHFDVHSTDKLVREITRVLKTGGIANVDSGPPGTTKKQVIQIFRSHGFELISKSKSSFFDLFTEICFRKTQ